MRKIRGLGDRKMQGVLGQIDTRTVAEGISAALRRAFGDKNSPVKRLARLSGMDPRAAENYWTGENCPRSPALIRLIAGCDEVLLEVLAMAGRDDEDTLFRLLEMLEARGRANSDGADAGS